VDEKGNTNSVGFGGLGTKKGKESEVMEVSTERIIAPLREVERSRKQI
jgi:hypothetical protein